jgi:hypothetical protein
MKHEPQVLDFEMHVVSLASPETGLQNPIQLVCKPAENPRLT